MAALPLPLNSLQIRVVCNNTLQMAVGETKGAVRVPHSRVFDPAAVKQELGLGMSAWDQFMASIKEMAKRPVNKFEAMTLPGERAGRSRPAPERAAKPEKHPGSLWTVFRWRQGQ